MRPLISSCLFLQFTDICFITASTLINLLFFSDFLKYKLNHDQLVAYYNKYKTILRNKFYICILVLFQSCIQYEPILLTALPIYPIFLVFEGEQTNRRQQTLLL